MSFAQVMEPPHVQSAMQTPSQKFQVRATQMFKKVTNIRTRFGGKIKQDTEDGPYKRQARSMDVRRNPFMSQPILALQIPDIASPTDNNSSLSASTSNSHVHPCIQIQKWDNLGHTPMLKSESVPAKQRTNVNTSAHAVTNDQVLTRNRTPIGVPEIIVSESRTPVDDISQGDRPVVRSLKEEADTLTTTQPSPTILENIPQHLPRTDTSPATLTTPPSIPLSMSSRPRDFPSQPSSAASTSTRRPTVPRLKDMPPSAFRVNEDGSARLSPSLITRPPPMPILNLPTLPTPTSTQNSSSQPRARLRSIPALSVDGHNELDRDPNQDDSGLGESDDEDDAEEPTSPGGSEDEEEDTAPTLSQAGGISPRLTTTSTQRVSLPRIDTTPFDLSFISSKTPSAGPSKPTFPHRREADATPTASHPFDYFSVKSQHALSVTPQAAAAIAGSSSRTHTPGSRISHVPTPGMARPVLYHHVSKSMVNMSPKLEPREPVPPLDLSKIKSVGKGKAPVRFDGFSPSPEYSPTEGGAALRRQRSMPIFNSASEPPPYPTFAPHPMSSNVVIQPRDDEGEECLPEYSNSIYLTAIMPRKMEFTAPGVQAKDRKWRRAICELEGTAFRVYKCPPRVAGGGVIGEWWEKAVGVGDVASISTTLSGSATKVEQTKETALERPAKLVEDARSSANTPSTTASGSKQLRPREAPPSPTHTTVPLPKPKRLAVSLLHPMTRGGSSPAQSRAHSRSQSDTPISPGGSGGEHRSHSSLSMRHDTRSSSHLNASSVSFNQTTTVSIPASRSSPPASATRSSFLPISSGRNSRNSCKRPSDVPIADPSDLIRMYSLQHAESGLGNDYLKRKNVIRVRMEGEQFLLQAQDIADVVEWIEAFHAATNIALDLDERTMPKGPMLPRRRRRRRRAPGGDTRPAEPPN